MNVRKTIISIMSRNISDKINLKNINKEKASGKSSTTKFTVEPEPNTNESPYFSPRKTRNHVKMQFEELDNNKKKLQPVKDESKETNKSNNNSAHKPTETNVSKPLKRELSVNQQNDIVKSIEDNESEIKDKKYLKWEPKNWLATLENIKNMRLNISAPVDTMGCDKCPDVMADEKTQRYHHLIALMLSSQTKDQVTYAAMNRLKAHGLTPENIVKTDNTTLEQLIYPVSFYKNKTKHIKNTAQILIDQYESDIPKTIEELIKLPGVGPKMGHICMRTAWNIVTGIGVDTHVHRISNRLRWVKQPTKEPETTRIALEQWLPYELWHEVNELLVGFGQTVCTPTYPKCNICENASICPSKGVKK